VEGSVDTGMIDLATWPASQSVGSVFYHFAFALIQLKKEWAIWQNVFITYGSVLHKGSGCDCITGAISLIISTQKLYFTCTHNK